MSWRARGGWGLLVGGLLVGGLLAGCGEAAGNQDWPFATYERTPDENGDYSFHAAGLGGQLIMVDGCLYVHAPERWLPVFPHDIDWDPDAQTLTLEPNFGTVQVGQQVILGGGAAQIDPDPGLYQLPPACELPESAHGPRVWIVGILDIPT